MKQTINCGNEECSGSATYSYSRTGRMGYEHIYICSKCHNTTMLYGSEPAVPNIKETKKELTMQEGNYVKVEEFNQLEIMYVAPGANKDNVTVTTDTGPKNSQESTIYLEVKEPEIHEKLLKLTDLTAKEEFKVSSKFDISTLKVGIKDGLIFMKIKASKDRIAEVQIDEE
jgi:hypothetical protein